MPIDPDHRAIDGKAIPRPPSRPPFKGDGGCPPPPRGGPPAPARAPLLDNSSPLPARPPSLPGSRQLAAFGKPKALDAVLPYYLRTLGGAVDGRARAPTPRPAPREMSFPGKGMFRGSSGPRHHPHLPRSSSSGPGVPGAFFFGSPPTPIFPRHTPLSVLRISRSRFGDKFQILCFPADRRGFGTLARMGWGPRRHARLHTPRQWSNPFVSGLPTILPPPPPRGRGSGGEAAARGLTELMEVTPQVRPSHLHPPLRIDADLGPARWSTVSGAGPLRLPLGRSGPLRGPRSRAQSTSLRDRGPRVKSSHPP